MGRRRSWRQPAPMSMMGTFWSVASVIGHVALIPLAMMGLGVLAQYRLIPEVAFTFLWFGVGGLLVLSIVWRVWLAQREGGYHD